MLNTRLLLGMAMVGLATSPACSTKTSLGQDTPCKPNAAQVQRGGGHLPIRWHLLL